MDEAEHFQPGCGGSTPKKVPKNQSIFVDFIDFLYNLWLYLQDFH